MINEYGPKGGWMNYYRRKKIVERIKVAISVAVLLASYAIAGYMDGGM